MENSEIEVKIVELQEFGVDLANEVLKVTRMINQQRQVIEGLMVVTDAVMTMNSIGHQRLMALEQRAQGLSFEEMLDGKEIRVGPTEEHIATLKEMGERFQALTAALKDNDE